MDDAPAYKGIVPTDAYKARDVCGVVPRVKAKDGDSLQREQLTVWFREVRQIANPVHSAYLQGLLITGARREEWAGLRWTDVDFRWRSLVLDDKVEGIHVSTSAAIQRLLTPLPLAETLTGRGKLLSYAGSAGFMRAYTELRDNPVRCWISTQRSKTANSCHRAAFAVDGGLFQRLQIFRSFCA
ncbi:integrase [Paraburkholderia sp. WSM4177]|nr:integrase [Paraburkholderia sp. WSM4177]MBB5482319.1 integrase [Paraburkholderia sp. WSM4180]